MRYIDESGPWTDGMFRKYSTYVKLRKERNKFLKSLQEMSYLDWSIDKKLVEAGGIGKTVYILPARGGHRFPYESVKRYFQEGRDVQFVTLKKQELKICRDDIARIRDVVLDWDLCYDRERQAIYEELHKQIDEMIARKLRNDYIESLIRGQRLITSASFDSYIFNPKTYTDWAMRDFLLNPHYGIVYKKDDTYYGGYVVADDHMKGE